MMCAADNAFCIGTPHRDIVFLDNHTHTLASERGYVYLRQNIKNYMVLLYIQTC